MPLFVFVVREIKNDGKIVKYTEEIKNEKIIIFTLKYSISSPKNILAAVINHTGGITRGHYYVSLQIPGGNAVTNNEKIGICGYCAPKNVSGFVYIVVE